MTATAPASPRIVVGVDPSDNAAQAVRWAAQEAADRGLALHLVHAIDLPGPLGAVVEPPDYKRLALKGAEELLNSTRDRVHEQFPDLIVSTEVSELSPAETLVTVGRDAQLVVTGTRGHGGFAGMLLGSVSLKLAAHSATPLTVVRGDRHTQERDEVVLGVEHGQDPAAVHYAFADAARHGGRVRAVRAWWPALGYGKFSAAPGVPDQHKTEAAGLEAALEKARAEFPDVEVVTETAFGNAVSALLDAARGARLLVVGAHHAHGPLSVGAGYVVQGLLSHSTAPVTIVPSATK